MKIDNNESNSLSFTGFGVYGLGYDSWFQSKNYFSIDVKSGNFKLIPDNEDHNKYPQIGKCFKKSEKR